MPLRQAAARQAAKVSVVSLGGAVTFYLTRTVATRRAGAQRPGRGPRKTSSDLSLSLDQTYSGLVLPGGVYLQWSQSSGPVTLMRAGELAGVWGARERAGAWGGKDGGDLRSTEFGRSGGHDFGRSGRETRA